MGHVAVRGVLALVSSMFCLLSHVQFLTHRSDVGGGGPDEQAGSHERLAAGEPGGHGGLAQAAIGGVLMHQQGAAAVTGDRMS